MATNYPAGLDEYADPAAGQRQNNPSHSGLHKNHNDAIEAIERELGTNPSGSEPTVKDRLAGIEAGTGLQNAAVTTNKLAQSAVTANELADNAVTSQKIAADAVGSSELADNAVDTAAIAANAVTAPKFAAGAMSAVLLAVARAQPVVSGGDAFDGPDPMWETIFGEPFADAGTPSAGTPAHTFDGGAAA